MPTTIYTQAYDELCRRGQSRVLESYTERHHIVPQCMGGSDNESNITHLTAREHFIAHRLLSKIHPKDRRMHYTVWLMANMNGLKITSHTYDHIRKQHAKAISEKLTGIKRGPHSIEHRQKLSKALMGKIVSLETREKMGQARRGTTLSDAHKEKIRATMTGRKRGPYRKKTKT